MKDKMDDFFKNNNKSKEDRKKMMDTKHDQFRVSITVTGGSHVAGEGCCCPVM